jgi:hypothetical protein
MTTVNPVVSEDGTYLGSEIADNSNHDWKSLQNEYVETFDGRIAHRFADVELEDEAQEGKFDFIDYATSLRQANPTLDAAIVWAAQGGAAGFDIQGYNDAVDAEDLDKINQLTEQLCGLYAEAQVEGQPEPLEDDEPSELDEWFDQNVSDEFIAETVEAITEADFTEDQVMQLQDLQDQYQPDSIESVILQLGVGIGNGDITGEEALDFALQNFGEAELAKAYLELSNILN